MNTTSKIYILAEVIVGLMTCFGNGLVLIAICRNARLQTATNCFIASLAIADFLVGIIVAPLAVLSYQGLPKQFLGCVFTNSIVVAFTQVSIFSLLAVAFERFFAIKHPFSYQKYLTIKLSVIINVVVWLIGMFFGFIPLFGWNLKNELDENWTCNFVKVIDMHYVVYFHFFGCIVLPLFIIIGIYTYIFFIVKKQMSQIEALKISTILQSSSTTATRFKKEIKAAKSLAIVIILFAGCWIPIHILNTITLTCSMKCPYPLELLLVTILLSHANSAVNPFLYAYGNSNFKHAFKKMFCFAHNVEWGAMNGHSEANIPRSGLNSIAKENENAQEGNSEIIRSTNMTRSSLENATGGQERLSIKQGSVISMGKMKNGIIETTLPRNGTVTSAIFRHNSTNIFQIECGLGSSQDANFERANEDEAEL